MPCVSRDRVSFNQFSKNTTDDLLQNQESLGDKDGA